MSRCTGHRSRARGVVWVAVAAVASAAAGCVAEPDVLVTVTRSTEVRVYLYVCDAGAPTDCTELKDVFEDGVPVNVERTVGLYIDEPTPALNVEFHQVNPSFCDGLSVPLDDLPLELTIALPASRDGTLTRPTSCPGCEPREDCAWATE